MLLLECLAAAASATWKLAETVPVAQVRLYLALALGSWEVSQGALDGQVALVVMLVTVAQFVAGVPHMGFQVLLELQTFLQLLRVLDADGQLRCSASCPIASALVGAILRPPDEVVLTSKRGSSAVCKPIATHAPHP